MQWPDLTAAIQNWLEEGGVGAATTADFTAAVPVIVNNAELRIYRDCDFLATRGQNSTVAVVPGYRTFQLSALTGQQIDGTTVAYPQPVIVEGIALVTPAGLSPPSGTMVPFIPASLDFIDFIWPMENFMASPALGSSYYAMLNDQTVVLAPTPDAAYQVVVTGLWRPAPMSSANPTTWLGTYASDLLFAACMIEGHGWIQNFGAQAENPQASLSWQQTYQQHWLGIVNEERRRKGLSLMPPDAMPPSMSDQRR